MMEFMVCPVRENARLHPRSPAVVSDSGTWTWSELDSLVNGAERALHEHGPEGTRVGVQMQNNVQYVALILAALRTGHVLALLSTRLPGQSIRALSKHVGTDAVIKEADFLPTPETSSAPIPLNRSATIVFTSGTTGAPKAALHTVDNHLWSARGLPQEIPLRPDDRWLVNLPLYHVGGLAIVYRCALSGAAIVLPEETKQTGAAIESFGVTHTSLVSTQLYRLLQDESANHSLKVLLLGGGPVSPDVLQEAHERGLPLFTSYGLTEMASTVSVAKPSVCREHPSTSGSILPYREVVVRDDEIHVRGPVRFAGYVTAQGLDNPFDDEGWFATGDLGFFDETGRLFITGRKDNQFVSGGENIQPEEIERVLETIPEIVGAIVVSVSDTEFGRRPFAFVETVREKMPETEITRLLDAQLPRFKHPVVVIPLPTVGEEKPSRVMLRARAEQWLEKQKGSFQEKPPLEFD